MNVPAKEMMGWIEQIVSFGIRRPGYPAGLKTEDFIASSLRSFGLERVAMEPVAVNQWIAGQTLLEAESSLIPCFPVPYTAWTREAGVQAPCVYVGDGRPADFAGKDLAGRIAIADIRFADLAAGPLKLAAMSRHDPAGTIPDGVVHKANWLMTNFTAYYQAQLRGAVGFIGLLADNPIDGCSYYVPYDGFLKDLPAVWVGREHAARLRRTKTALLKSLGTTERVDSHNVLGWVPGTGDETILLTCHHDAPFASAVEDGSGLAVLLALAKTFAAQPRKLRRSLLFVAASGHFHGGIGNRTFCAVHKNDWLKKTVAALGVEHIAQEAESDGRGGYRLTGRPEMLALFCSENSGLAGLLQEGLRRWGIDRTLVLPPYLFGPEPPCDAAPYFTEGIPSASLISGPLYLFDDQDTMDKVRVCDLEPVASFFEELILKLDGVAAEELAVGLTRRRTDPPAAPPPWFLPPQAILQALKG